MTIELPESVIVFQRDVCLGRLLTCKWALHLIATAFINYPQCNVECRMVGCFTFICYWGYTTAWYSLTLVMYVRTRNMKVLYDKYMYAKTSKSNKIVLNCVRDDLSWWQASVKPQIDHYSFRSCSGVSIITIKGFNCNDIFTVLHRVVRRNLIEGTM